MDSSRHLKNDDHNRESTFNSHILKNPKTCPHNQKAIREHMFLLMDDNEKMLK